MLITSRPGANRDNILSALQEAHRTAESIRGGAGQGRDAYQRLLAYLQWATAAAQQLRYAISDRDLSTLIFTARYYALLSGAASGLAEASQQALVNGLVTLELDERTEAISQAIETLKATIERWKRADFIVIADSSFYVQSPTKLADVGVHEAVQLPTGEDICLMFPIVVIEELDDLKESGKHRARWRAGHTLGLLDGVLSDIGTGFLSRRELTQSSPSFDIRGEVAVEVLLDPPGHVRLSNPDDEIIDRAAAVQALVGKRVIFLTCDTSQATRGRIAGLDVRKLPAQDIGDEPDWAVLEAAQNRAGNGGRAARRARQEAQTTEP